MCSECPHARGGIHDPAGPAVLPNPQLLARYENAPGAATITSVVGAGVDVDLGLVSLSERAAAVEAEALRTAELLDEVCAAS
jgi:hypothetical protein